MKKLILFLLITTRVHSVSVAQVFNTFELNGGLYFGKPIKENEAGQFKNSPFKDVLFSKAGFTMEGIVFSRLSQRSVVGIGLKFTQINYEHIVGGIRLAQDIINFTSTTIRNNVTINSIGVPVLCKFEIFKKKQLLQAIGGFGFYRFIVRISENEVRGAGASDPAFINYQIDDISKKYNLSTQLGLRALIKIKDNHAISIGCRAEYFLVQDKYYENGQGNILGLSATIGYVFESIE